MNGKFFKGYCVGIALILFLPLLGTCVNFGTRLVDSDFQLKEPELSGVVNVPEKPEISLKNLASGTFQDELGDYLEYHLFARRILTRTYNQLLYSVFHSTDNREMLVGQDDYVFEKAYATAYLTELTDEEIRALEYSIGRVDKLHDLLKERGIPLVIRMSPSKAEFYPEYLPSAYDRFVEMKQGGAYAVNWYQAFTDIINKTDIPVYDRHDMLVQMKNDGEIVFAKGGTHWTLAPMAEYINGLNALLEELLEIKLGRMVVTQKENVLGQMGNVDDSDIWQICWNALNAEPNYLSPHIQYTSTTGDAPLHVFMVGQSFSTLLLSTIYSVEKPVWTETYFSWYNSRVLQYKEGYTGGIQFSESTDDYEQYLQADVIIVEFLENGPGWIQFEFVENMLHYLEENEETA